MPNCFQLLRKSDGVPEKLSVVDEKMCAHLGVPCDDKEYYGGWYNYVGVLLSLGKSFDEIREIVITEEEDDSPQVKEDKAERARIIDFLEENYTSSAWYSNVR